MQRVFYENDVVVSAAATEWHSETSGPGDYSSPFSLETWFALESTGVN